MQTVTMPDPISTQSQDLIIFQVIIAGLEASVSVASMSMRAEVMRHKTIVRRKGLGLSMVGWREIEGTDGGGAG